MGAPDSSWDASQWAARKEPELPQATKVSEPGHREPRVLCRAAEQRFQDDSGKRSFKFFLAYIGVQILYLGFYFAAAQNSTLNYVPLLADSVMLTLHCGVVLVKLNQHLKESGKYRWSIALALLADAVLFAIADPVVEVEIEAHLEMGTFFEKFGGLPTLQSTSLPHPYKSNLVFQFHCLYMTLMVLSFSWSLKVMPVCMLVYSTIVVISFQSRYDSYEVEGFDPTQDREEVYIETVLMWWTLLLGLFAKWSLEQAQRPLFLALESGKDEIIREKVKRCNAEYRASGLLDKMNKVMQQASYAKLEDVSDGFPVFPAPPGASSSVHSAPVRAHPKRACKSRADKDAGPCDSGDCLPASASVWIENQAMPQRLGTVRQGQRVLCYDNLLRGLKYTDILDVSVAAGSECTDWVTVRLKDGTRLEMTPNHPVECFSTADRGSSPGRCIPAGAVQADRDAIIVLKTVLVPVSSVHRNAPDPAADEDSSREWINLMVQHPDRHTVFVADGCDATRGAMAVGTPAFSQGGHHGICVKHSFLQVEEDAATSENVSSRRTVSAPDLELTQNQRRIPSTSSPHDLEDSAAQQQETRRTWSSATAPLAPRWGP
ncbi:unnamed protein product [Prorocentrum cordatum]|uniref:Uncharacterized protein n=1 Tax=Prorocentrum cordatum TaxID=2364126 RepID=A0ABN9T1T3_9DINO|nr:unnamed protein product [Polarella glacialis]